MGEILHIYNARFLFITANLEERGHLFTYSGLREDPEVILVSRAEYWQPAPRFSARGTTWPVRRGHVSRGERNESIQPLLCLVNTLIFDLSPLSPSRRILAVYEIRRVGNARLPSIAQSKRC